MAIQQNTDRILTTHIGSLPRPIPVLDMMKAKYTGSPGFTQKAYDEAVTKGVAEIVKKQLDCGLDIITDGECSKPGFFTYIRDRLDGFEARPNQKLQIFTKEIAAFPDYYEQYFKTAMMGGTIVPIVPVVCTGPITYKGQALLQTDIDNLKAAVSANKMPGNRVFMPSIAPSGVGINEYYKTLDEYFFAVADALHHEYKAIIDAGFLLQIDDPFLPDIFVEPDLDEKGMARRADLYVEAVNAAIKGLPVDRIRYHICYGINHGPRVYEGELHQCLPYIAKVNCGSFSFEGANPRHEHDYHLFENFKLKDGQVITPGVITHASNIIEHPEYIAERIVRFAKLVGRENVVPGADCGFSTQAQYNTEINRAVIWKKFEALAEGARIATKQLWK